ncbi:MAG: tetratricopeptide repeat protein [Flavobacteriales bacterium]
MSYSQPIKGFCIGILILLAYPAQGQLIQARNLMEEGDLLKARSYADKAVKKDKHAKKARAWYFRGKIHYKLFRSSDEEHRKFVKDNDLKVAKAAAESYLKVLELDQKEKFIKEVRQELPVIKSALLNQGVQAFNERKHKKAYKAFSIGIEAGERLNNGKPVDTLAYFNGGLSARKLGKYEEAMDYFKTSLKLGNREPQCYFIISRLYKRKGKTDKAFEMVKKGRKEHPEFRRLVLEELNYFIKRGKYEKARKRLEKAVKKNPRNSALHFSLGTVYDQLYDRSGKENPRKIGSRDSNLFKKAKKEYGKAIELDSSYHGPYYSLGALYYNRGIYVIKASNTLKGQTKYEEEIKEAEKDFERALPYLKKAHEIKPDDTQTIKSLRNVYSRLGKEKKAKEMQNRLEN